ncbi:MAG: hypothetical protein EPN93_07190 [Spirochaetes bacterium]|nr:MAG: hypothetical protein EPN93_07190 [Spirochaetota bacterium]
MNTYDLHNLMGRAQRNGRQCRRNFLLSATAAGLALAGLSCAGVTRTALRESAGDEGKTGLSPDEYEILRLASLAPSGHNTQPWTVRVAGKGNWIIGAEKSRMLPAVDPENRELLLSLGAFMENLVEAAGARGLSAEYSVVARGSHDAEILDVRLSGGARTRDTDAAIVSRRTVRKGMLRDELRGADVAHLSGGEPGFMFFTPSSAQGAWLAQATVEANRAQAWRDDAQTELADWIRWRDADAKKHRNGLTPEGMEIGGLAGWFVRNFYDRGDVLGKDFRDRTVDMTADQVKNCGGWMLLVSSGASIAELIETGRRFQRMLLRARERMVAVHPMTQILEESPWRGQAVRAVGAEGTVQFILRTGYLAKYPDPVSLRRPVEWFLKA